MTEHSNARTLFFNWGKLTKNVKILLAFSHFVKDELTPEQNYVAWKVIEARQGSKMDGGAASVHYSGQIGFSQSHKGERNVVEGTTFVEMPQGSSVEFILGEDKLGSWGPVTKSSKMGTLIKGKNLTGMRQNLGLGTFHVSENGVLQYEPVFHWDRLGEGQSIQADFQPSLIAVVGQGYEKSELITLDLSDDILWQQDLSQLPVESHWDFIESDQGGYKILPAAK